jgi:hypothetical protein
VSIAHGHGHGGFLEFIEARTIQDGERALSVWPSVGREKGSGMRSTDGKSQVTHSELGERSAAEGVPDARESAQTVVISSNGSETPTSAAAGDIEHVAGGAPVRVCRRCSTQSRTSGEFCPHCGARFLRRAIGKRGKILIGVLLVALLTAGGATAVVLRINHDNQVKAEKHRKAVAAHKAAVAAHKAALAAQAARKAQQAQRAVQQAEQQVKVDERKALVDALQNSITKDAQKDIENSVLSGPNIAKTVCTPVGGGNLQDTLADHTGDWSCLAVNQTSSDGTESGYGFHATINYDTGSYTWQLGNSAG